MYLPAIMPVRGIRVGYDSSLIAFNSEAGMTQPVNFHPDKYSTDRRAGQFLPLTTGEINAKK